MTAKHTHWGIEYLTNSSGRREGWHLSLQSIRPTRFGAWQADLDNYLSLKASEEDRHSEWHALRNAGKMRAVKLSITKVGASQHE